MVYISNEQKLYGGKNFQTQMFPLLLAFLFGNVFSICHWGKYDIMFNVDASCSIQPNEFIEIKNFMHEFIRRLHVHPFYVNVGMIQFSCTPELTLSLPLTGDYYYAVDFVDENNPNSVTQVEACCTNMFEGLELAYNTLYSPYTRSAPKVVINLSDGATHQANQDVVWCDRFKADGALVFGIGVGIAATTASQHMTDLCNRPEFYHDVADFDALDSTIELIGAYLPCGLDPVLTAVALLPFIIGGLCCCLLLMALLGGIAMLFLARFQVPKAPPKVEQPDNVDQSMYYVSGQQTAVNWGKDGMVTDTQFRPGDMGMGENFGRNKGINPEDVKAQRKETAKKKRKWCVIL